MTIKLFAAASIVAVAAMAQAVDVKLQTPGSMTFTSNVGRFQVTLPGQPSYQAKKIKAQPGFDTMHCYTLEPRPGYAFLVMYSDLPVRPANPSAALDDVLKNYAADGQHRVVKHVTLTLEGHPGRGVIVEDATYKYIVTDYLAGARLYQVMVVMPKVDVPEDAATFLKSFRIL